MGLIIRPNLMIEMNPREPNKNLDIVAKVLSKNATENEKKEVERFSPTEFQQLKKIWDLTERLGASPQRRLRWQKSAQVLKQSIAAAP